ncbi:fibronectin type III domain-containing protein [Ruminococcus sp.]|uniref:fibronectin type III domain-containing protein n=1 Tax=Ruminococcus sp. TaxID=41978 RepID=UPI0025FEBBAB|nr:fibronectin type III domain-containing protein [Ruminococcus sp.]
MKDTIKKSATIILAAAMIGASAVAPTAGKQINIFSQTTITAEAASVGKVSGLTSKTLSNSEIKLSWKKVSGASGYSVCMRKGGKYNQVADVKGTSYTVKGLPNATRENFKVRAYKTVKGKKIYGAYSDNRNTATNPQAAKGLKVTAADSDSVKLSWTKIGCTNYRVFQLINDEWKEVGKTTSTNYTVKNLTAENEYKFKIRACKTDDKKANHYGKYSDTIVAATNVQKVNGVYTNTISNSEIKLSWNKVNGADGYQVGMRKDGKYNEVADVTETKTVISGLPNATRENFKVRAYKVVDGIKCYGSWSENVTTATNPQACKGLKVTSVTDSSVKLSWTKIGYTDYRIYQLKNGSWKEVGKTTGTSYTVKNLSSKTTYEFKIRACKTDDKKSNHYGAYSDIVSATTLKSDKIENLDDVKSLMADIQQYADERTLAMYGDNWTKEEIQECNNNPLDGNGGYDEILIFEYDKSGKVGAYSVCVTDGGLSYSDCLKYAKKYIDYVMKPNDWMPFEYYKEHISLYLEDCPEGHNNNMYLNSCYALYFLLF